MTPASCSAGSHRSCSSRSPRAPGSAPAGDDAGRGELTLRVPAGLRLARSLDALSVSVDTAAVATETVTATPGMIVGVETESFISALGEPRPARGQRRVAPGRDFDAVMPTWSTSKDGVPLPGTRYGVEVQLVLFETDVAPGPGWDPRAGRYRALWTRTLRQAEE